MNADEDVCVCVCVSSLQVVNTLHGLQILKTLSRVNQRFHLLTNTFHLATEASSNTARAAPRLKSEPSAFFFSVRGVSTPDEKHF